MTNEARAMEGACAFCKMQPRHHSRILGLLIAGAAAMAPASAQAATVSETPGILTYATAPGEANHVTIVRWGSALKVTDTGTRAGKPITVGIGPGCWKLSANSAACWAAVSTLIADLGDGNDFFDASDTGVAASVMCGAGDDTGVTTNLDSVAADCEFRPLPAAVVPDPQPVVPDAVPAPEQPVLEPTLEPSAVASPAQATIPAQTVGISASGVARVQVVCPADSGGCAGTVSIELPTGKAAAAARRRSPTTIGQARFRAKAGTAPIVRVRLSKRGRQRIVRGRSRRGRIRVATRTADGTTVVTTQDVTFSTGPKAKRGRGRR